MTLREYIFHLQEFAKKDKRTLDLPVVYSVDDEGNDFKEVLFNPTLMKLTNGSVDFIERGEQFDDRFKVCIN
jgi:hypothetical protein